MKLWARDEGNQIKNRTGQVSKKGISKGKDEIFLANCFINRLAKQKRDTFLRQIDHISFIRVRPLKAFSILPVTEEDWFAIKQFYSIVNKGDFGTTASFPYERPSSKIFAIYVPSSLFEWFSNNSLHTIQKQISLYNATVYYWNYRNKLPNDLSKPLFNEIELLINKYYSTVDFWEIDINEAYRDAALDYCNTHIPPLLTSLEDDIEEQEGVYLRTAYFSYFDWNYHIENKVTKSYVWRYLNEKTGTKPKSDEEQELIRIPEQFKKAVKEDNLERSESDKETWSKWLMTFQSYALSKSHIFGLFDDESVSGYVYIFKGDLLGLYKIGFTRNSNVEKRKLGLQTSTPEVLHTIGSFPVASIKAEETIKRMFSKKRRKGEWFALSGEDIDNLLSSEWKRKHNIF